MTDFLSSPFPPVMANLIAASSAGKSALLTDKKRESLWSKPLRAFSEKMSCLQETFIEGTFIDPVHKQGKSWSIRNWQRTQNPWKGLQKTDERK